MSELKKNSGLQCIIYYDINQNVKNSKT